VWKDFFSFTKRERTTIVVVFVLIVLVQGLIWTSDTWVMWMPYAAQKRYAQEQKLRGYADSIWSAKSIAAASPIESSYPKRKASLMLVPFNPNTADSVTLLQVGLKPWMVKNILKYRAKGGCFRKADDFARVYGLDAALFKQLKPFLCFDEIEKRVSANLASSSGSLGKLAGEHSQTAELPLSQSTDMARSKDLSVKLDESRLATLSNPVAHSMDLNSTDTAQLQQIKGVGAITANRIARYRKQLGGFYSLEQLEEVKGLYPETLQRLKSMLRVDPNRIYTLDANKASLEKLREHPYISFWQAKVIVDLRKARGVIRSLEELAAFKEFKPDDLERLKWYLAF
jgi:DNA uptake protein ComE-like DNA-binding protein